MQCSAVVLNTVQAKILTACAGASQAGSMPIRLLIVDWCADNVIGQVGTAFILKCDLRAHLVAILQQRLPNADIDLNKKIALLTEALIRLHTESQSAEVRNLVPRWDDSYW